MDERSLLKNGRFLRLWAGQAFSFVGDFVSTVALVILVADVSGSASAVGGVLVARLLPTLASPLVGLLTDRLDRRVVLVASDLARAALVFGLIFARDAPAIYALVFLMGADRTVSNPTVRSAFPSVVGRGRPDQGQRRHQRHVQLLGDGRPSAGCSGPLSGWSWPSCSTP